ncbi:helicase-related protein [Brevibacterium aurantiacum]|uniref:helicase-related protein n=1 Tax=Brevibacterium aurantiacum TaxID=273384 RepID=UPI00164294BD|nr:helicase-related protein [Brevibacterium aurantiacum]
MTGDDVRPVTDTGHDRTETDTPPDTTGPRFVVDRDKEYVPSGPKARFQTNLAAIERVRELTESGRTVTGQDQEVLAGWSSWGAVADVFDEAKENWSSERDQLRQVLTDDEWEAARATTLNAHFTSPAIVAEMWSSLERLGVTEGRVLEPGCGSGNFIGSAPESMSMVGVEIDPLSAQIASYLYPHADVRNESFGKTLIRPNQFDAAIANVPFGNFPVFDPSWNPGERFSIHNHFIRKAVGCLHDGGVAVMMTSAYTMDAKNPAFRAEIGREADFLGAVRLPTGAHRRTAGTEVVTDVLVFRKRLPGEEPTEETLWWVKTQPTDLGEAGARPLMNRYFHDHPENILGELEASTFRDSQINVRVQSLEQVPELLRQRLSAIVDAANERGRGYVAPTAEMLAEREREAPVELADGHWPGTLVETEPGHFVRVVDGRNVDVKVPKNAMAEVRSLMDLRDRAGALVGGQVATPVDTEELVALREDTLRVWEKHVAKFGPINRHGTKWQTVTVENDDTGEKEKVRVQVRQDPKPAQVMRDDPLWSLTKALETYNDETGEAVAADILHQRTVEQNRPLLGADTAEEALGLCLDAKGKAEIGRIANLLGTDETTAREELGDLVFDDPASGQLATRAEYLSGNVRRKLAEAERVAENDDRYTVNAQALMSVIPDDIPIEDITPTIGAVWIPASDHEAFLQEIAGDRWATVHKAGAGYWDVKFGYSGARQSVQATTEWGTSRMPVYDIYRHLLTGAEIQVMDTMEDKSRVLNPTETEAARAKAEEIAERFEDWVFADPARAERLSADYNRRFNALVPRDYTPEAERLTFPGLVDDWVPKPHQRTAVARMIAEPAVGLFHVVGAGKTGAAVIGMMELKRRGLVTKPAVLVPGHMLEQFTREWQEMYPNARLLAAGSDDLAVKKGSLAGRREFVAKAATGDWDGIIMTHSSFKMLGVKAETAKSYFRDITAELDEAKAVMEAATESDTNRTVKQIENAKKKQEARLEKILAAADETNLTFEATGIDYLTVDEAHEFKNLHTPTSIAGAFIEGSEKATDMEMKISYLRDTYGERVVTMATGTPIANSISEAHVMTRYLRPDLLEEAGVRAFDQWGSTFGETVTRVERDAAGRLKQRTRFAKFKNVPEMLSSWQQFADVKRSEDLNLPVPEQVVNSNGDRRPEMVVIPRTEAHAKYMEYLEGRLDKLSGRPEKGEDNHLTVYNDGRQVALDPRMVGLEFSGDVKLNYVTRRIAAIWRENRDNEYLVPGTTDVSENKGGLQLVFCDLSTPTDDEWNAYDQMKSDLVAKHGMDRSRIRFIHEAKDDEKRANLFRDAREGRIDVLIGSSQKMGTGANIQNRAAAMHHVDCPWRPDQLEQREGRILRQGNENSEVQIYRYATENTFDSTSWDIIGRKATAIAQVMRGRLDVRELDDPGDLALDAQQMMAGSSGNPLLVERTEVDVTLQKLSRRARGHDKAQAALKFRRNSAEQRLGQIEHMLPAVEEALTRRIDTQGDRFRARIAGVEYDNRGDASEAIYSHIKGFTRPGGGLINGEGNRIEIGGFFVNVDFRHDYATGRRVLLTLEDTGALPESVQVEVDFDAILDPQSSTPRNVAQLLENKVTGLDKVRDRLVANRAEAQQTLEAVGDQLGKPFKHADELAAAKAKLADIDAKIKEMQEAEDRKKRDSGPEASGDGTEAGYSVTTVAVTPTRSGVSVSEPDTVEYTQTGRRLTNGPETSTDEAEAEAAANRAKEQSVRADEAAALGEEHSQRAFQEVLTALRRFQERGAEPVVRATETKVFWQRMGEVEDRLRVASTKYAQAAALSTVDAKTQVYDLADVSRIECAQMVGSAREARIPGRHMTDQYLHERLPQHANDVKMSRAYEVMDAASIESMATTLRKVAGAESPSSIARLQESIETFTEAISEFEQGNRMARVRLGSEVRSAAMAEECLGRLSPAERQMALDWAKTNDRQRAKLSSGDISEVEAAVAGKASNDVMESIKAKHPHLVAGLSDEQGMSLGIPQLPPHGLDPFDDTVTVEDTARAQERALTTVKTGTEPARWARPTSGPGQSVPTREHTVGME